jgi:glycosyltransferase involved in cell wall biosynthesis
MKILIAADLHWPTINGVASFSRNLAKGLSARGHEVIVIAPSQTGKSYEEYDGNYLIKRTRSVPFPFYQNFRISVAPQIEVRRIIKDFQPDIIHLQMLLMIGFAVREFALKRNIPMVATNHAIPDNLLDNLRLIAPFSRSIEYAMNAYGTRFYSKVDYITLPTQAAIDMFKDFKVYAPMEPVSNGIDLTRFTPSPPSDAIYDKFGIPRDKQIVSYLGRVDVEKHIDILLKAYQKIMDDTNHLLIVGSGTETDHLRELANDLEIADHTTFTGRVSDEEIAELHKVGTVYCMPSPAELQCITLLESMASGKPAVAVDAGALKELCQDNVNGILCPKDDIDAIADALKRLLDDKKLREKFAKASIKIAATHDITYTLDRFEAIYTEVIAAKNHESQ